MKFEGFKKTRRVSVYPAVARAEPEAPATVSPPVAVAVAPAATVYARIDMVPGSSGPAVMEAELIEPELFLGTDPAAPGRYARCLARRLSGAARAAYP